MARRGLRQHPGTALPFPLWRRERPAWLTVSAAEQLKRTYFVPSHKSKHAAAAREHGNVLAFAASGWACDRFADPRGVAGKFLDREFPTTYPPCLHSGPASNSRNGLTVPSRMGAVI